MPAVIPKIVSIRNLPARNPKATKRLTFNCCRAILINQYKTQIKAGIEKILNAPTPVTTEKSVITAKNIICIVRATSEFY